MKFIIWENYDVCSEIIKDRPDRNKSSQLQVGKLSFWRFCHVTARCTAPTVAPQTDQGFQENLLLVSSHLSLIKMPIVSTGGMSNSNCPWFDKEGSWQKGYRPHFIISSFGRTRRPQLARVERFIFLSWAGQCCRPMLQMAPRYAHGHGINEIWIKVVASLADCDNLSAILSIKSISRQRFIVRILGLHILPTPTEIAPKGPSRSLHVSTVAHNSGSHCSCLACTSLKYTIDTLLDGLWQGLVGFPQFSCQKGSANPKNAKLFGKRNYIYYQSLHPPIAK